MRREYRQRAALRGRRRRRRGQQGQGIFDFIKKVAKNPIVRSVAKKGLEHAPDIDHNLGMENILLQFLIRINIINLVRTGGALWTFI